MFKLVFLKDSSTDLPSVCFLVKIILSESRILCYVLPPKAIQRLVVISVIVVNFRPIARIKT